MSERWIELRRQLHQIPELGFQEWKTQALLLETIASLQTDRVYVRTWKTGVLVRVAGTEGKRCIAFRADMDGLPIVEQTGLSYRSMHEGNMHACGHDVHMAIAMGVLAEVIATPLADDVLIVFQPAEEGPGGALPMMESDVFREWWPDQMLALHIAPEYPVGTIATKPGVFFANTSELVIDLHGYGGHAAFPHQTIDTIVVASSLVQQMQSIVARNVNPLDSAVITIGTIAGGTRGNIIADHVQLTGTIRTLTADSLPRIKQRIESLVHSLQPAYGVTAEIDYGINYVHVHNDEALTEQFMHFVRTDETVQDVTCLHCPTAMTGEDFGYFVQRIPGLMFWLGVDTPYGLHHSQIAPNETAISIGIRVVTSFLRRHGTME